VYFEITPKIKKEDLFGRKYLVDSLVSNLNDKTVRFIVIKGLRRTGKTSLLNVALQEFKQKKVKIDVRESPYFDRREFMSYVAERIHTEIGESLFHKILKHISGVKLAYGEISTTFYLQIEKNFLTFFRKLNEQLEKRKTILVLAFDEVQLLREIKFDTVLAAVFDNYSSIKMVLTGSEIGLVDQFLGRKDAVSPLYGRALLEVEIRKLNDEQVSRFLTEGFKQLRKEIGLKEIGNVIEVFDGVIGWSTYYGWLRSKNISHQQAVAKVIEEGSKMTKKELEEFLARRSKANYLRVLRWIAQGYSRWSLLKNRFFQERVKISDRQLSLYLNELIDYSFLEKRDQSYFITDPLLVRALG